MRTPLALAAAALLAACSKPQPSPEYEQARQLHARLVARAPLDPYAQPEMAQVADLLSRVPAGSADAEAAQALREKVDAELRAQAEERTRRARLVEGAGAAPVGGAAPAEPSDAPAPSPGPEPEKPPEPATPPRPASQLAEGTPVADFEKKQGDCFEPRAPARIVRPDGKATAGQAWALKDTDACRKAHPAEVGRLVIFADGKLLEVRDAADAKEEKLERKVQGELKADGSIALPRGTEVPPGAKVKWEGAPPSPAGKAAATGSAPGAPVPTR